MLNLKELFGLVATIIAFVSYVPYLRDVIKNKTTPHLFTWLIWGTLTFVAFLSQVLGLAGPGAWPTGLTVVLCVIIVLFALRKGKKDITHLDIIMLIGAGISLTLWFVVKQPVLSILLVTLTDGLGFIPTVRKSWSKPHEETLITFVLSGVKHIISLFAITNYSLITALYPTYLVVANVLFVTLLIYRRGINNNSPKDLT